MASPGLTSERRLVLSVLVALAAAGWALVIWQAAAMDDHGHIGLDLTMGMAAPLFLAMWVAMMVAMMLPASAPMILAFSRSQARKRERGAPYVPTWLFVLPYLAVWGVFGLVAYALAATADSVADDSMWAMDHLPRIAGGLLIAAGAYQLTPLKRVCLGRCRSPLSFMLTYWRDGRWGAAQMGLRHGVFCLGCCWLLFLVLVPLGVMNVGAMLVIAALVFAEKTVPQGERVAKIAAIGMVVYGSLALAVPATLPTMA
ncbi:MAG: DUF2182 domain-containing protein [Acidimicrobiales bacterium]